MTRRLADRYGMTIQKSTRSESGPMLSPVSTFPVAKNARSIVRTINPKRIKGQSLRKELKYANFAMSATVTVPHTSIACVCACQ